MSLLAIYAWNPLVVVESAASGHNDSLAVAAVLAALLLIIRRRPVLSTLALAAAILTKVFPLVLAPLWLRIIGWPRRVEAWVAVGAATLLAFACTWPYRSELSAIVSAYQKFSNSFIDNASLFLVLQWFSGSMDWARGISAGIVAGLSIWVAARGLDPIRAAYLLFGAILLVSQNTFSWYFVWIIPLLCFFPNPAWLLLTILQFLSYHVLIDYQAFDRWEFKPLFLWLTYGPAYLLLVLANPVMACTAVVRRSVLTEIGGFDETIRFADDYDLWLRIVRHHAVAYVDEPLAMYRVHASNESKKTVGIVSATMQVLRKALKTLPECAALVGPGNIDVRFARLECAISRHYFLSRHWGRFAQHWLRALARDRQTTFQLGLPPAVLDRLQWYFKRVGLR